MNILFENADFLAIDKPTGLSVHNNEGGGENLLTLLAQKFAGTRFFPVHRLDKETSGVQIVARNDQAARRLAEKFQGRTVRKIYRGILRGSLPTAEGIWNAALTDKAEGRIIPAGRAADRVPCETRFRVIQSSKFFTLCEFHLITGRQHQIRKHAALCKHALVGDSRYGDAPYNRKMAALYNEDRMFLHCLEVEVFGVKVVAPTPDSFALLFGG